MNFASSSGSITTGPSSSYSSSSCRWWFCGKTKLATSSSLSTPRGDTQSHAAPETHKRERERKRENGAEQTCLLATTCEHERSAAKLETGAAKLVGETVDSWTLSTDPPLTTDPSPHFSTYLTTYLLTYLPTYLPVIPFCYLPI
jgi:hypothetical protein